MSRHLESAQQEALIRWRDYSLRQYPDLEGLHHIPNGGKRNEREAARLKREGVKAGVYDLFLPVARDGYHGLYIEMKYGKGKLTNNQKNWKRIVETQGYKTVVAYSWIEAARKIVSYLTGCQEHQVEV